MSAEKNKALVRRSVDEFYNGRNQDAADEFFSTDYVGHDPAGFKSGDVEQLKQMMTGLYASFPDFHLSVDELIAEGDRVVKRWTVHLTHQGEYLGLAPTGKTITFSGTDTYRVAGGKLAECWSSIDWLGFLQQLGAVPALG